MARPPRYSDVSYSFGPGALSPAIKMLLIANVVAFLVSLAVPAIVIGLALVPGFVVEQLAVWRLVTYMFLHGGISHLLFNMLSLWMFGTELEKMWGTRFFTKYYFVTGIGAGVISVLWGLSPLPFADEVYNSAIVGASGAIYGVLLAYGLSFPHRPIYMYFVFPIPAKYFVMIIGAIAFLSSVGSSGRGVAHSAHLGGLLVGYLYLKGLRGRPLDNLKYRWLRWRMNRARNKFGVYSGGRSTGSRGGDDDSWKSDWKKHIH
jgi:membrane associated rhomboid family serine protease